MPERKERKGEDAGGAQRYYSFALYLACIQRLIISFLRIFLDLAVGRDSLQIGLKHSLQTVTILCFMLARGNRLRLPVT